MCTLCRGQFRPAASGSDHLGEDPPISSNEKARKISVLTLPSADPLKDSAAALSSSGAFSAMVLKASARPIVSLMLRTPYSVNLTRKM
jgi:hypothetical protein